MPTLYKFQTICKHSPTVNKLKRGGRRSTAFVSVRMSKDRASVLVESTNGHVLVRERCEIAVREETPAAHKGMGMGDYRYLVQPRAFDRPGPLTIEEEAGQFTLIKEGIRYPMERDYETFPRTDEILPFPTPEAFAIDSKKLRALLSSLPKDAMLSIAPPQGDDASIAIRVINRNVSALLHRLAPQKPARNVDANL